MKFILFVEGHTEKKAIPAFLKRWLDTRLNQKVGIKPVRFDGWAEMDKDMRKKTAMYLNGPSARKIIAVVALLDLYGPTIYPNHLTSAEERTEWAITKYQKEVGEDRFRMFFAVHEVEAWLLSAPEHFPPIIGAAFPGIAQNPEKVNFDQPPAKLLDKLYRRKTKRNYKKVTQGKKLFDLLDPDVAYKKCPQLKKMLDDMLTLAKEAGL